MGIKSLSEVIRVRLKRDAFVGGKLKREGFILQTTRGAADILVNRRKIAEYIDPGAPGTLVPNPPGLGQLLEAAASVVKPHKKVSGKL